MRIIESNINNKELYTLATEPTVKFDEALPHLGDFKIVSYLKAINNFDSITLRFKFVTPDGHTAVTYTSSRAFIDSFDTINTSLGCDVPLTVKSNTSYDRTYYTVLPKEDVPSVPDVNKVFA